MREKVAQMPLLTYFFGGGWFGLIGLGVRFHNGIHIVSNPTSSGKSQAPCYLGDIDCSLEALVSLTLSI